MRIFKGDSFFVIVMNDTQGVDAKYLRISAIAKIDLFSSFEGLSLEDWNVEGIEIPSSIEFVTSFTNT